MSAFIVSDATINAILAFAVAHKAWFYTEHFPGKYANERDIAAMAGQVILNENYRAVNYRYEEATEPHALRYDPRAKVLRPVEVLKLIGCIEYQLAEPDDYKRTEAWELLQAIKDCAIRELPGYGDATRDLPEVA